MQLPFPSPRRLTGVAALGCAAALTPVAALAATSSPAASSADWHVVDTITTSSSPSYLGAIVSTGKTSGYVFGTTDGFRHPVAYERTGTTTWKKVAFPGESGERVGTASATSPTDVWAFSSLASGGSRVFELVKGKWTVVKTFSLPIASATVLSGKDVWVFGIPGNNGAAVLGVYHYDGRTWTRVSSTLGDGYAMSGQDVWAYSRGTRVENYNGHKWTATGLATLLPKDKNVKLVDGVIALGAKNVYVLASDFAGVETAALYVLHYNGHTWSKVARNLGFSPANLSPDGKGGFYFTAVQHSGGNSFLLHYHDGKLADVAQLSSNPTSQVYDVSRIPATTQQLVTRSTLSANGSKVYAEVLQGS